MHHNEEIVAGICVAVHGAESSVEGEGRTERARVWRVCCEQQVKFSALRISTDSNQPEWKNVNRGLKMLTQKQQQLNKSTCRFLVNGEFSAQLR